MAAGKRSRNSIRRPNPRARAMWAHTRKFREIDLHGMIVEDAVKRVSVAISEAVKRRETRIRINHGKGTGTLRHEIRAMLGAHPSVGAIGRHPRRPAATG